MSYRPGSTSTIGLGSTVTWRAGKSLRTGVVTKVIHAGRGSAATAAAFIAKEVDAGHAISTACATTDRREVSFIVASRDPGPRVPRLFWPRTGALAAATAFQVPAERGSWPSKSALQ